MPRAYIETILSSPGSSFARPRTGSAGETALVPGDQLRVEARLPIPRHLQRDLARVEDDRLAAVAVAAVAGLLLTAEVVVHLGVQRPLGQGLLQAVEETVRIERRLWIGARQQLVQKGVGYRRLFASRHVGAPLLPSCPLTHEIPDRATASSVPLPSLIEERSSRAVRPTSRLDVGRRQGPNSDGITQGTGKHRQRWHVCLTAA